MGEMRIRLDPFSCRKSVLENRRSRARRTTLFGNPDASKEDIPESALIILFTIIICQSESGEIKRQRALPAVRASLARRYILVIVCLGMCPHGQIVA